MFSNSLYLKAVASLRLCNFVNKSSGGVTNAPDFSVATIDLPIVVRVNTSFKANEYSLAFFKGSPAFASFPNFKMSCLIASASKLKLLAFLVLP